MNKYGITRKEEIEEEIKWAEGKINKYVNKIYNRKLKLLNNKFPVLPGNQEAVVEFENATNISIQPRWWTL